jgi:sugar lactone lactonase YvrE
MFKIGLVAAGALAGAIFTAASALGHGNDTPRPLRGDWATVLKAPVGIEGLTSDRRGNLYTPGRAPAAGQPCPVFKLPAGGGAAKTVGTIPPPCGPAGLTFGPDGKRLFIGDGARIVSLIPDERTPPVATVFATGTPGANGLAFDSRGTLWVSDGGTAQGSVWRVSPSGVVSEAFRVQPMANAAGVGRQAVGLPPGSPQGIVANGLAFGSDGTLYVADTARGAIWQVRLDRRGNVLSRTGCDTTFAADTLCLDDVFVEHPYLEGSDGIVIGGDGTIYAAANERNAIVAVSKGGNVAEVFRNPVSATGLRNEGPLEFPTSPVLVGRSLCVTNSDGARRDNVPATAGEGAKVNCSHL